MGVDQWCLHKYLDIFQLSFLLLIKVLFRFISYYALVLCFSVFMFRRIKQDKSGRKKCIIQSFRGSLKNQATGYLTRPPVSPDTGCVRRWGLGGRFGRRGRGWHACMCQLTRPVSEGLGERIVGEIDRGQHRGPFQVTRPMLARTLILSVFMIFHDLGPRGEF